MLKNLSIFLLPVVILMSAFLLPHFFWHSKYNMDISCIASLTTHSELATLHGTSSYIFNSKGGILNLNGYQEEDPSKVFNRKILFDYTRDNETYTLRSLRNIKYPDDTVSEEWMDKLFPGFYVYEGKDMYIKVIKQFNNNYLFFIGSLPTFSCKHTENILSE